MKSLTTIATAIAICSMLCGACKRGQAEGEPPAIDTLPMLITQVQKCSRLYTAEYSVRKIVTYDDIVRLKGSAFNRDFSISLPLGDRKIAIPMQATIKAYVDFANFGEANVERHGDKITIILPDPKVTLTATKIDHDGIKEYVSLTRSRFTDAEMSALERQGRQAIIEAIPQMGIVETTRLNAARVLIPMIGLMGYRESDITVTFRENLDPTDLGILLDKSSTER